MLMDIFPFSPNFPQHARRPERELEENPIRRRTREVLQACRVCELGRHGVDLKVLHLNVRVREVWRYLIVVCIETGPCDGAHQVEVHGVGELVEALSGVWVCDTDVVAEVEEGFSVFKELGFDGFEGGVVVLGVVSRLV